MNYKKFSVLMSVYIKENPQYLDQSLDSVFTQTIMPDEVVLMEDGKLSEELYAVIKKYKSKYNKILKVIKNNENRGLGIALHDGILECSNELIFRMDTDDICEKTRFEEQLKEFNKNDYDLIGTFVKEYDEKMEVFFANKEVPETDQKIKIYAKKRNPFNHQSVAFKKSAVLKAGNYKDMLYFEDYYLWIRMIKNNCKFYNIPKYLVKIRSGNEMLSRRGGKKYIKPIINFQKALLSEKIITKREYYINVVERIVIAIIPNKLRIFFYKNFLRH